MNKTTLTILFSLLLSINLPAQVDTSAKIEILEEEIEKLKIKKATKSYESHYGMGPAASAVYEAADGISLGGYAEITATDYRSPFKKRIGNAQRFVLYTGYHFNDWLIFNSEFELEHAGFEREEVVTETNYPGQSSEKTIIEKGKASLEFAYLDFRLHEAFNIRAGLNLVPTGITNFMHEPVTFYSVYRPLTETTIIPSTWKELGILFHGNFARGKFSWNAGIMSGLDGRRFTASNWIGEDGSFRGSQAEMNNLAGIVNFEFKPSEALTMGGSYYMGGAGQGNVTAIRPEERLNLSAGLLGFLPDQAATDFATIQNSQKPLASVTINLAEAHFQYQTSRYHLRGLFARSWMNENDSRSLNRTVGENIGRVAEGGYIEAGVNLFSFTKSDKKLVLFVRDERVNTQRYTNNRYAGNAEDMLDAFCSNTSTCKSTSELPNGDLDLGFVPSVDPDRERYGVKGVADQTNDRTIVTVGMAFFPNPNVVLKLEYAQNSSASSYHRDIEVLNPDNNKADQINFGMGLIF